MKRPFYRVIIMGAVAAALALVLDGYQGRRPFIRGACKGTWPAACFISEFVLTYVPFRELEQSGNPIV